MKIHIVPLRAVNVGGRNALSTAVISSATELPMCPSVSCTRALNSRGARSNSATSANAVLSLTGYLRRGGGAMARGRAEASATTLLPLAVLLKTSTPSTASCSVLMQDRL